MIYIYSITYRVSNLQNAIMKPFRYMCFHVSFPMVIMDDWYKLWTHWLFEVLIWTITQLFGKPTDNLIYFYLLKMFTMSILSSLCVGHWHLFVFTTLIIQCSNTARHLYYKTWVIFRLVDNILLVVIHCKPVVPTLEIYQTILD